MLIFGWQRQIHTLAMITLVCGRCGNPAAQALRKLVTKFTLFFIPLIPLSTKHYLECTWCGAETPLAVPQIPALLARANTETMSPGQNQQPALTNPNANWPQQPTLNAPNAHRPQPAPNAQWQQLTPGTPNATWPQQPTPGTPNAHWQQPPAPGTPTPHVPQPTPGTPNPHWQQR